MNQEFVTMEMAKVYEAQGHYKDALDIYKILAEDPVSGQKAREAVSRVEAAMETPALAASSGPEPVDPDPEKRLRVLLERWLRLLILKKRLDLFQKFKARF